MLCDPGITSLKLSVHSEKEVAPCGLAFYVYEPILIICRRNQRFEMAQDWSEVSQGSAKMCLQNFSHQSLCLLHFPHTF